MRTLLHLIFTVVLAAAAIIVTVATQKIIDGLLLLNAAKLFPDFTPRKWERR